MIQAAAVALGAFLLFSVQPLVAKMLLPSFGGAASVWTVCLLFFQTLLLAGYIYAHYTRPIWHVFVLAASILSFIASIPATPADRPTAMLLWQLTVLVGAPYFVLATTSPLLQRWSPLADPYRLYALSNVASVTALLAYPVLVEPYASLHLQMRVWIVLFVIYCIVAGLASIAVRTSGSPVRRGVLPSRSSLLWWVSLAATGSTLLMATTNQICQEVASVPFLWVAPLAIYLASFIICFDRPHWYDRRMYSLLASMGIPAACALWIAAGNIAVWIHIAIDVTTLFACLMLVHGELARSRPPAAFLTWFYIAIAAGGALGGALVVLAAPRLFTSYAEFPIALAASALLVLIRRWREGELSGFRTMPPLARASAVGLGICILVPFLLFDTGSAQVVERRRNFYGVLRVTDRDDTEGHRRVLTHGATTHGAQFLDPTRRRTPTTYYGWASGIGLALENHARRSQGPLRVGVIGLGVGTLARYGRAGDRYRFYEINPQVIEVARTRFTFLSDSAATPAIIEGDARLSLAAESDQQFDVLVLDAFSSDAIPTHLLTAEAGDLYNRHLRSDGRLLVHISNRTLNLEPVVRALARRMNRRAIRIESPPDPTQGTYSASWMDIGAGSPRAGGWEIAWTDDFSGLWRLLQ